MRRLAAVLLAVLALLATACSGGDSDTEAESSATAAVFALDTMPAWTSVETAIAAAVADDDDGDGTVELDSCPFGIDGDALLEAAFADGGSLAEQALAGAGQIIIGADGFTAGFSCNIGDEQAGVGLWVNDAVDDLNAFHEEFAGQGPVSTSVTQGDSLGGGRLFDVCVSIPDFPEGDYCEVDWMDEELVIGFFVYGDGADGVDLSGARAVLVEELPGLIDQMAAG